VRSAKTNPSTRSARSAKTNPITSLTRAQRARPPNPKTLSFLVAYFT
jgi:hypothetical protein